MQDAITGIDTLTIWLKIICKKKVSISGECMSRFEIKISKKLKKQIEQNLIYGFQRVFNCKSSIIYVLDLDH